MKRLLIVLSTILATGCSSLDNPCNDQGAGHCASVTTAYENSLQDTVTPSDLPRGQSSSGSSSNGSSSLSSSDDLVAAYNSQQSYSQVPQYGDAMRTAPKSMRVWILPYEDEVGLYHDQQYVYALVEKGVWKYKSVNLSKNTNKFVNTYASSNTSKSSYQPFAAPKESDVTLSTNQSLISSVGTPNSSSSNSNPFSAEAISNKNTAAINSVSAENSSGN